MKPTTPEPASATSSSFFRTALCTEFSRPEIGFQSNHSDRRSSTLCASVINDLLITSPLDKSHLGPSGREEDGLRQMDKASDYVGGFLADVDWDIRSLAGFENSQQRLLCFAPVRIVLLY